MRTYCLSLLLFFAALASWSQDKAVVHEIRITGTEKTRDPVIIRELIFHVLDTLNIEALDSVKKASENNVYNLGLFTRVSLTWNQSGEKLTATIDLQERWYILPTPYLALEERTFNEWWADKDLDRLVYGLGVQWGNFTGWNDDLDIYLQGGYSRRINLLYSRPFLFKRARIDGTFGFRYLNNKEIGYGTKNGVLQLARLTDEPMRRTYQGFVTLSKRFTPRKYLHFTADYQVYDPNDSIVYFNDRYLTTAGGTEYYPSLTTTWVNDQRDLRTFPLKGYKFTFAYRQAGFPGLGTTNFSRVAVTYAQHIPLTKRFNFAYGLESAMIIGDRVPFFDKLFIGFKTYVRGYETYVIDGSFLAVAKTELKFAIFPRKIVHVKQIPFRKFQDLPLGLYLSVFADGGFMHDGTFNNGDNTLKDQGLGGYGVGINLISIYDWLLRVEYSWNKFGRSGIFVSSALPIR